MDLEAREDQSTFLVMRRLIVFGITFLLLALVTSTAAAAVDMTPPKLVDVRLSSSSVEVAGLDVVHVSVSVHLMDESGVATWCADFNFCLPRVHFTRVNGGAKQDERSLKLTSGIAQDGIWSGDWVVPSSHNGEWQVSQVIAMDSSENYNTLYADPRQQGIVRSLLVSGSHIPNVSMGFSPEPVRPGQSLTVKGRAYFTDTGAPITNHRLWFGDNDSVWNSCSQQYGETAIVTDARGYWGTSFFDQTGAYDRHTVCVYLLSPNQTSPSRDAYEQDRHAIVASKKDTPIVKILLAVQLTDASIPAGSTTSFVGNIRPTYCCDRQVYLQRYAAGLWRTVYIARIRPSSRFTLNGQPPYRGTFSYRVWAPGNSTQVGSVSKTFRVTAY
jgi:hypothetical protein